LSAVGGEKVYMILDGGGVELVELGHMIGTEGQRAELVSR